jgi:hypothetical protein
MKPTTLTLLVAIWGVSVGASAAPSRVRDWMPDYVFKDSSLKGWAAVGDVDWTTAGGEIVARPKAGGNGGWLIFERPLQDVAISAEVNCAGPCQVGVAMRVQRSTMVGGILASFGAQPAALSTITADRRGREVSRTRLAVANGQARFATPLGGVAAGAAPSVPNVDSPITRIFPRVTAPVIAVGGTPEDARLPAPVASDAPQFAPAGQGRSPDAELRPNRWNEISALVDANVARASLNGGREVSGVTGDDGRGFGPIALYVGPGSGEVRFRNLAFKDLGRQAVPAEQVSSNFRMQRLDDFSYAWDAAVADVNRDGVTDVIAGPYYYLGPGYTERRELYIASTFSPGNQYAGNMVTYAFDFTRDGWPDVLATEGRQMALLVNPRNEPRRWTRHMVVPGNTSELTLLADLDRNGMPELLMVQEGRVAFAQVKKSDPTAPWPVFYVSEPGTATLHSFGVGDINGDGRNDILQAKGWWEQPNGGITAAPWKFHPTVFANPDHPNDAVEGGGEMSVVDVNRDGLNDVITSINAHGWGLAWFEQRRSGGEISFASHLIMGDFARDNPGGLAVSQLHAGAVAVDVNRDGVIDFFTGKKQWAHLDSHLDPDPNGPAYILLYKGVRDRNAPGGVRFVPEVVHNRSGVGSRLTVADINKDGSVDLVTSGVRGTFIFWGKPASHPHRAKGQP